MNCEICEHTGGELLWQDASCRVVRANERGYPGFCRVIWHTHIKEMTDLEQHERTHLMHVVFAVEAALRELLNPHKVNLASFGNVIPHLHWHVIPRFTHDPHFPLPAWGEARREPLGTPPHDLGARIAAVLAAKLH